MNYELRSMNKKQSIANLIFEAAVVKRLKRTGWQILGDNEESLGEHTFLSCVIAYVLSKQMKANTETALVMALFHDFHEARTGDVDKIALRYIARDQHRANRDIFQKADAGLLKLLETYEKRGTLEAKIAHEANVVALLVELKLLVEKGNVHAKEWLEANQKRLKLPEAIELADQLAHTDSHDWWKGIRRDLHEEFSR